MKISYNWLKNYINTDLEPENMSQLLTDCGLEVEGMEKIESIKGGLKGIIIGKVLTCIKHPAADKLSITTVDIGAAEPLNIVCGASNVAAGQTVPVATIGATMYSNNESFTIKKTKLRGEPSEGMICAEDELGLGNSHDGIMVLDNDIPAGTPAREYFQISEDIVFEIGLTPNRSDATSHIGVARDVKAVLNRYEFEKEDALEYSLILPDVSSFAIDNTDRPIEVEIMDPQACRRYMGLTLTGITVKESPEWLKNYITAVGLRPINNIVDISNFVLMETGQPLHIFDADKITGNKVIIKKAQQDEIFVTLDEVERKLSSNDLTICNTVEPMCIAGVFGGLHFGVTPTTKNIFIESAWFDAPTIRKTSKKHALQTDASFRYERGADIEILPYALKRAALLVKEMAGGTISSNIVDKYPMPLERNKVSVSYDRIFSLIGKTFSKKLVKTILLSLDIAILEEDENKMLLEVPTAKTDVTREADIIEEVLRVYGYNNVEIGHEVRSALSYIEKPSSVRVKNRVADYLTSNGYNEIMNNSLTGKNYYDKFPFTGKGAHVEVLNPLSKELNILRRTLLFGGLEVIAYNQNRKRSDLKLYEFGESYHFQDTVEKDSNVREKYTEINHLSLFLTGKTHGETWKDKAEQVTFFDLKVSVFNILKNTGMPMQKINEVITLDPYFAEGIDIMFKKKKIAVIGMVAPAIQQHFDIQNPVFFSEINWDILMSLVPSKDVQMQAIPKFPAVRRDLALLVDKSVSFKDITEVVKQNGGKLVKNINLFDVYEGEKLEEGKKSYAISLQLQDSEMTLTEKIIDKTVDKLIKAFEAKIGATIR